MAVADRNDVGQPQLDFILVPTEHLLQGWHERHSQKSQEMMFLHRDAFTQRGLHTEQILHAETLTDRNFHTKLQRAALHTKVFTHRCGCEKNLTQEHFSTTPFHTETFTQRKFYTETLVQRCFYGDFFFSHRRGSTQIFPLEWMENGCELAPNLTFMPWV